MQAKDVMTTHIVTVEAGATVREIASVLAEKGISAVPVVDEAGAMLGIVSEGDLIRRQETETAPGKQSWWLRTFSDTEAMAQSYAKSHGAHACDIMTQDVVTVSEQTALAEVAEILETRRVKRVPVMRDAALVGIVSRANIVQALAARPDGAHQEVSGDDAALRTSVIEAFANEPWSGPWTNVIVRDGVVELYGTVDSEAERNASRIAAENVAGVVRVNDRRGFEKYSQGGI